MNTHGLRALFSARYLTASLVLLFFAYPALCADKSHTASKPTPPPKSSGGGGGSHNSASSNASHSSTPSNNHPINPGGSGSYNTNPAHVNTPTGPPSNTGSSGAATTSTGHSSPTGGHPTSFGGGTGTSSGGTGSGSTGGRTFGNGTGTGSTGGRTFGSGSGAGTSNGGRTFGSGAGTGSGGGRNSGGGSGAGTFNGGRYATGGNGGGGFRSVQTPRGHTNYETRIGGSFSRRPDGRVASLHDSRRGMDVHHSLSGNRHVMVEHGDHSRVFVERGGHGYVQRPYTYHGHEYAQRAYYSNGHYYHAYYGRYYYHGIYVNPYYPSFYYRPAYYGWVYNPWIHPVRYAWGWGGNPWYGYYGSYFTPYPAYSSASLWLTDYLISSSLEAAYQARADNRAAALDNPAPLTPEVKELISDEVRQQIALENTEAGDAGRNAEPDAASSSIQRLLTDGKAHVFVAGHDLDVTDAGGSECALSEGDALQLTGQTAPDAQAVNLAVLASKGGRECPKGDTVSVALQDLQDMQNHMRQTIDLGMQELQKKQGQGGLPAAPASATVAPVASPMAAGAPPPPPENEVAAEINQQSQQADQAEKEASAEVVSGPGPNAGTPAAGPINIDVGQTIDQVTTALGTPLKIVNLGAKRIYVYKDIKVTFTDGKVTDVQ